MKYLLIILIAITFMGCAKRRCDDSNFRIITLYDHEFLLTFVDQSGNNLINNRGTGFDTASIKVYDINNNLLPREFSNLGPGESAFWGETFKLIVPYIFDKPDIVYKPICKKLYINLGNDRDTLDYCFNTVEGRCGPEVIDLTACFNGKIFFKGKPGGGFVKGTIVK